METGQAKFVLNQYCQIREGGWKLKMAQEMLCQSKSSSIKGRHFKHKLNLEETSIYMCSVPQIIQPSLSSQDSHDHTLGGEEAQVHTMQLFSQSCCSSKRTHQDPQRGKEQ